MPRLLPRLMPRLAVSGLAMPRRVIDRFAICRLVALLWIAVLTAAGPAPAQSVQGPFEADRLEVAEIRIVQSALALTGDYAGLVDGDWGPMSGRALWQWAEGAGLEPPLRLRQIAPLLRGFEQARQGRGWQVLAPSGRGWSLALPTRDLQPAGADDWINFASPDDRLRVSIDYRRSARTRELHGSMLEMAAPGFDPYRAEAPAEGRLVTSVQLRDGGRLYLRSQWLGDFYVNVMIYAARADDRRLALIAASIGRGAAPPLSPPSGGLLDRLLRGDSVPGGPMVPGFAPPPTEVAPSDVPPAPPSPGASRSPAPAPAAETAEGTRPQTSGSGFFVNPTDLVTNAHVVAGCTRLQLGDGTAAEVITVDADRDLAALSVNRRTDAWLTLGDARPARLGEVAVALGYPLVDLLGDGVSVTLGNISALPGGADRLRFTAPIQPGNSGGPLLNAAGQVLGVVVARADDARYMQTFGTLPQNINFAIGAQTLTRFLREARVNFPGRATDPFDIDAGLPAAITEAVVLVQCYR